MTRDDAWWLSSSEHVITKDVAAPVEKVRDFYCDLRNIPQVHPLVVSVDVIDSAETADYRTQTCRVRDRIPFGPLALNVFYTATVRVPPEGDVLTEARQFPRVRLSARVSFDDVGAGITRVTERITIEAPRPLASTTVRQAVAAHAAMLTGIHDALG